MSVNPREFEMLVYNTLVNLLEPQNYKILLNPTLPIGRPDFIIEKDDKRYVIEVKASTKINFYRELQRILTYIISGKLNSGFLVISSKLKVPKRIKEFSCIFSQNL